jgi:hypothetical protein
MGITYENNRKLSLRTRDLPGVCLKEDAANCHPDSNYRPVLAGERNATEEILLSVTMPVPILNQCFARRFFRDHDVGVSGGRAVSPQL